MTTEKTGKKDLRQNEGATDPVQGRSELVVPKEKMAIDTGELARALPSMLQRTMAFLKDSPQFVKKQKSYVTLGKITRGLVEGIRRS